MKQFISMDTSKDGNVDINEFVSYCKKHPLYMFINENPNEAFKKIDNNHSGNMTIDEFCN